MKTVNEKLLDAAIRKAIFLERFKGSEARQLLKVYTQLEADIIAQLARRDPVAVKGRYRMVRLQVLLEDLKTIVDAFGGELQTETLKTLQELGEIEAEFAVKAVVGASPVAIEMVRPASAQVKAAIASRPFEGRFLQEYYAGLTAITQDKVKAAVRMGVLQGETLEQIGRRIRLATGQSRRGAEMIARTAVSHVSTAAHQMVYAENGDIIKGLRWVATLDRRTTVLCASRDGMIFPVDSEIRPPAHFGCRSRFSAVMRSWRELGIDVDDAPEGTRASMDGQVPASTTYAEWLKSQPAAVQDEVLGKAKGALFRRGGLTLDKFVMADGSELTLKQVRARYADAFDKAGL